MSQMATPASTMPSPPSPIHVYTRERGGRFRLDDAIDVEVAEISGQKVKLALTVLPSTSKQLTSQSSPQVVRASGSGYYRFQAGKNTTLFTSTDVGKALRVDGRFDVTVIEVTPLQVTISAERSAS